jgi:hypothetical protein
LYTVDTANALAVPSELATGDWMRVLAGEKVVAGDKGAMSRQ